MRDFAEAVAERTVQRPEVTALLGAAGKLRDELGADIHDDVVGAIYHEAEQIAGACVTSEGKLRRDLDAAIDRIVTSRIFGLPLMLALLGLVFWLTIAGANVPSAWIADRLFALEAILARWLEALGAPWWLTGALIHGMYRGTAWVVSVMLPPMAIFFPTFTLLEDLGYLPRVAFNLDRFFRKAGAHGKQALTMSMGFGCNAAGVIACRVIDSPRERLIAILTNNFVPCNGRFPTLIMLAMLFVAPAFGRFGALAAAGTVVGCVLVGVTATLLASALLSRTVLKGVASSFTLELPSYRRPRILQVLYTSVIDRTLFVLWRAVVMAAPAGLVCWILGNWTVAGSSVFEHLTGWLDPIGRGIGLDGVVMLAYIVAIPANEIVVPTLLMGYGVLSAQHAGQRVMVELDSLDALRQVLVVDHGWTLLTAVCLMLFSILHNPCSTTAITIYKETGSRKWTLIGFFLPLTVAFVVCFLVAQIARLLFY